MIANEPTGAIEQDGQAIRDYGCIANRIKLVARPSDHHTRQVNVLGIVGDKIARHDDRKRANAIDTGPSG